MIGESLRAPVTPEMIERWHEFYLMAGTAAVTLVGLLFVALSFHLDTILHEKRSHLLSAARLAFMNFIFVLMLSLFFLIPGAPPAVVGGAAMVLSIVTLGGVLFDGWKSRVKGPMSGYEKFLVRRYMLSGVIMGVSVVSGFGLIQSATSTQLLRFVMVVCAMLANAAGMSWDLLVQVGRMRRFEQGGAREGAVEGDPK